MVFSKVLNVIYENAGHLAIICLSITVLLCLIHFKQLKEPYRRLCYFLLFNLTIEVLARVFIFSRINNLPLLHIYTLGEFLLLTYFYQSLLLHFSPLQKRFTPWLIFGAVLIVLNSIFINDIFSFNPLAKTFVQLCIMAYAVIYFYTLSDEPGQNPNMSQSLRLINSAILIYYSGSLFIFMCNQLFFENSELYKIFWTFNAVLNAAFQLLMLWGIWKVVYKKTPLSS